MDFSIRDVFHAPTLRDFAMLITERIKPNDENILKAKALVEEMTDEEVEKLLQDLFNDA